MHKPLPANLAVHPRGIRSDVMQDADPGATAEIAALATELEWRPALVTLGRMQRHSRLFKVSCSKVLRVLRQLVIQGEWRDRDVWRQAVGVLGHLSDANVKPDLRIVNLGLQICKESRAVKPVFWTYDQALRERFRPNEETFEILASSCVVAPSECWWRALRYMKQARALLPDEQLTAAMAKSMKACVDAGAWSSALFQLGSEFKLEMADVPGVAPAEAMQDYLEAICQGPLSRQGAHSRRPRAWSALWSAEKLPVRRFQRRRLVQGNAPPEIEKQVAQLQYLRHARPDCWPGLSDDVQQSFNKMFQQRVRLQDDDQELELLGIELLCESGVMRSETVQAFRRSGLYPSLRGLQRVAGHRYAASLRDPLLGQQRELGVLGVEEALKMLGFRSGRSRSARPGRRNRWRLALQGRATKLLRLRQVASRGRRPARRWLREHEGFDLQAAVAWISFRLELSGEVSRTLTSAGRCVASGARPDCIFLPLPEPSKEHPERAALASVLNLLAKGSCKGGRTLQGGILLYSPGALCISCLAAFCHCKRFFPLVRQEICWDPGLESHRWRGRERPRLQTKRANHCGQALVRCQTEHRTALSFVSPAYS
ncbi:unnamed protein product [Effrenium voratum]|nr:unnamed protein product [Effrenium voratum]